MAWSTSKVFAYTTGQTLAKAVSWSADTIKVALYSSNTMTPDNTVTTAALTQYNGTSSQWVTANEVSGTGYTAGGVTVTPTTLTQNFNSQGNNNGFYLQSQPTFSGPRPPSPPTGAWSTTPRCPATGSASTTSEVLRV